MAVAVCVCAACSVHSQQKHQIASRLVLGAQNVAYQKDVSFEGPWPTAYMISVSQSTLRLSFDLSNVYVHKQHGYIGFEVSHHRHQLHQTASQLLCTRTRLSLSHSV